MEIGAKKINSYEITLLSPRAGDGTSNVGLHKGVAVKSAECIRR